MPDGRRLFVRAFRLYRRSARYAHRVIGRWDDHLGLVNQPIVTLVWWGKKRRDWGFHTSKGWVPWKTYAEGR